MNETFKGLPVQELCVAAVCIVVDVDPDQGVITEMEVLNEAAWKTFKPVNQPNRCGCCGHSLKYACGVVHLPTGNGYWVGRDCANKVERLRTFGDLIARSSVALAERIACNKREADFLTANPDFMGVFAWCKLPHAPRIAKDMIEKMRRFGNLSENQVRALEKIKTQDEERRSSATGTALTGRQKVHGTVASHKKVPGFNPNEEVIKITVDLGNGVRAFGNAPSSNQYGRPLIPRKGDQVEFTATFEPSKTDNLFGFWKRPAKFKIVKHNSEDTAKWQAIFDANPGLKDMSNGNDRSTALWAAVNKLDIPFDERERFVYENIEIDVEVLELTGS